MLIQFTIMSSRGLAFERLLESLGTADMRLAITPDEVPNVWAFYREKQSVTLFMLEQTEGAYTLSMDRLASYEDYRFLPYLLDTLSIHLTDEPFRAEGKSAYLLLDEEWVADTMGEEIAYVKCFLSMGLKYYISLPIRETNVYVDNEALNSMGVCIYSSTPRLFGYITYMLRHDLLPTDEVVDPVEADKEIMVDVPQHRSIGTVLSWQTDGSETTESYAQEDVDLLLRIAQGYAQDKRYEGVVLNDIATIYERGIGVEQDAERAVYWYNEAIRNGDLLYAPTSLGDIYRRGLGSVAPDLRQAIAAYRQSVDPYAWYRIGQSYEEGWTDEPDLRKAMEYYQKAAAVGHHLALKRLSRGDSAS